jgi:hypothetical protein
VRSGWSLLAERYKSATRFEGQQWRFQSGMIGLRDEVDPTLEGLFPFRAALDFGTNAQGLYISVFLLFRWRRPALFIPWSEISVSSVDGVFAKRMKLDFRSVPRVSVYISNQLAGELIVEAPLNLHGPDNNRLERTRR